MHPGPCLLCIAAWALPSPLASTVAHIMHMPSSAAQPQHALHCSCSLHSQLRCCHAERQGAVKSLDYALAAGSSAAEQAKAEVETTLRRTSEQVCILAECALAFCFTRHAPSRLVAYMRLTCAQQSAAAGSLFGFKCHNKLWICSCNVCVSFKGLDLFGNMFMTSQVIWQREELQLWTKPHVQPVKSH